MIIGQIIFSIIAFSLFVIMFFKMISKNDTVYIIALVMQAIGIAINFIVIIFSLNFNIYVQMIVYLLSIILPLAIIILEAKGRNIAEELKLMIARIALKCNNTKLAKKILLELVTKYPKSYAAHRYLAEV